MMTVEMAVLKGVGLVEARRRLPPSHLFNQSNDSSSPARLNGKKQLGIDENKWQV
jgi:hypothetical protein